MATDTSSSRPAGAVAEAREKSSELVSGAQTQISETAHELGGKAEFKLREQLDERSTQAGEQVQSIGKVLQSGANQLRSEGQGMPARVVDEVARRADDLGSYLQEAHADRFLHDLEAFARRRPWVAAGIGALAGFAASRFVRASSDRRHAGGQMDGRNHGQSYSSSQARSLPVASS